MHRLLPSACLPLLLLHLLRPSPGHAHDPPYVMDVFWEQNAEAQLLVWTNRGLIHRPSTGPSTLLCTEALRVPSGSAVQLLIAADGSWLFATQAGLLRTRDQGCTFSAVEPLAQTPVVAMVRDNAQAEHLVAIAGVHTYARYDSFDGGLTFEKQFAVASDAPFHALHVARGNPQWLYGTLERSSTDNSGAPDHLAVSRDGGQTFNLLPLPLLAREQGFRVLDILTLAPTTLLLATLDSTTARQHRLLLTEDGGQGFRELLQVQNLASARFGTGGDQLFVTGEQGLWHSRDGGSTFTQDPTALYMTYADLHGANLYGGGLWWGYTDERNGLGQQPLADLDQQPADEPSVALDFSTVTQQVSCPPSSPTGERCAAAFLDWQIEVLPAPATSAADPEPDAGANQDSGQATAQEAEGSATASRRHSKGCQTSRAPFTCEPWLAIALFAMTRMRRRPRG